MPRVSLLNDDTVQDRVEEIYEELEQAQYAARHIQQHGVSLTKLEPLLPVLQSDLQHHKQLQQDYAQAQNVQRQFKQQAFALNEVVHRRAHFSYTDSAGMLNADNNLNDKLRQRLEHAAAERTRTREKLRQY